jgi:uncharacterized protein
MTTVNLRTIKLRSGEQFRDVRKVELAPLELGGQRYAPTPANPDAVLTISRLSSGLLFELELETKLYGPCMRCLEEAAIPVALTLREYQATSPGESEELESPYVVGDRLELSAWARDAIALSLPDQILCKAECGGLCVTCGGNLNRIACACPPPAPDNRFAKLAELRDRL